MMKDLSAYSYPTVSPSLLAADHAKILSEIRKAQDLGAHFIHIDVMDGKFVPNVSFGEAFVHDVHDQHQMVNDTHIMIEKPWLFARAYCEAGADVLTFHLEACPDEASVLATIKEIRSYGVHPGLSIKPLTPIEKILPYLDKVDLILVMSVEPGKGGQSFIPKSLLRLAFLKKEIAALPSSKRPLLEVDGGINELTGPQCVKAGADLLVAGSYLYGHEDMGARMRLLVGKK
jgi:ribulose-phosphate 3-epimerase